MTKVDLNLSDWLAFDGTDESAAFNAAADEARSQQTGMYMPEGVKVYLNAEVNLRYIRNLTLRGQITCGPSGTVTIGASSSFRDGAHWNLNKVLLTNRTTQTNPALRIVGAKGAQITVDHCDHVDWYANGTTPEDTSCSYNTIHMGLIRFMTFTVMEGPEAIGWITELVFIGGDFRKIETRSETYNINEIVFIKPCIESGEYRLNNAHRWQFLAARGEKGAKFWLGPNTSRVLVEDSHISNFAETSPSSVFVEDLGIDNQLVSSWDRYESKRVLAALDETSTVLDKSADIAVSSVTPGAGGYTITPGAVAFDTGLLPVRGTNDRPGFEHEGRWSMQRLTVSCDKYAFIPRVTFYDKDKSLITDEAAGFVYAGAHWNVARSAWITGPTVPISVCPAVVRTRDVAYIRFEVMGPAIRTPFNRLEIVGIYSGGSSDYPSEIARRRYRTALKQATLPRVAAREKGQLVPAGRGKLWSAVEAKRTALSSPVAAGSSTGVVSDVSGIAVGDIIGIVENDGGTAWAQIVGLSSNSVTVDTPPTVGADAGATVVTTRWQLIEA